MVQHHLTAHVCVALYTRFLFGGERGTRRGESVTDSVTALLPMRRVSKGCGTHLGSPGDAQRTKTFLALPLSGFFIFLFVCIAG